MAVSAAAAVCAWNAASALSLNEPSAASAAFADDCADAKFSCSVDNVSNFFRSAAARSDKSA
ncbi:MAG: hypothetical protein II486_11275, partial [Thermoguttaceae bacterium]|nr:hypothetical protein [Thermoguttaceae bacterium]